MTIAASGLPIKRRMRQRRRSAFAVLLFGLPVLTYVMVQLRGVLGLQDFALIYLLLAVLIGAIGGRLPALVGTAVCLAVLDYFFTPPFHHVAIDNFDDVITLVTFVVVCGVVSSVVDRSARRAEDAEAARADASAAEALVKTNEMRAALLSAVSHDLRTPLASIKTAATTLLSSSRDRRSASEMRLLETMDRSSDRLTGMVANLLDSSRLRAGELGVHVRSVSVDEVLAGLFDTTPSSITRVELLVPDGLPLVDIDPVLMERVLVNVVENALYFTPEGGRVGVEARGAGPSVELRVVDHGPGIPLEDRGRVFEPFQRLDDSGEGRGVGLGLAVAYGFMSAMGGSIQIEDTAGGGATIVLSLPVSAR